ncbi:uncharacterized protein VP01_3621g2 [Puccinia sorghi]|uniref:Copia protein n=1 Tax=Puccinia sorghi TaxID=27349 RepID=A0A0L6UWR8_9BASI|nr:uncharacterized protein VP01_3621g2 [Puccinia sorghi]
MHGITLDGSGVDDVTIYTDADFANCVDDCRSYCGYITTFAGNVLSWCSKKQQTVSTSITEAEYRALLNLPTSRKFSINVDNQSAPALATNPIFQQRTKHIDITYHWLREIYDSGQISIMYIPTSKMKADMCTKYLGRKKHQEIIADLKMPRR